MTSEVETFSYLTTHELTFHIRGETMEICLVVNTMCDYCVNLVLQIFISLIVQHI